MQRNAQHILSECLSLWQDLMTVCVFAFRRCVCVMMYLGKHASVKTNTQGSEVDLIPGGCVYLQTWVKRNAAHGSAAQCG